MVVCLLMLVVIGQTRIIGADKARPPSVPFLIAKAPLCPAEIRRGRRAAFLLRFCDVLPPLAVPEDGVFLHAAPAFV
jgi:hypothetical protein